MPSPQSTMSETIAPPMQLLQPPSVKATKPIKIDTAAPSSTSAMPPPPSAELRNGHLSLDVFSGSFAFDKVLKNGKVHKRTRKTKQWKSFYLVLRPNLLSLYKSPTEERLLKQITVSELTAVAYLKDPKGRRDNLFGLYSPSRNWHLQAQSAAEAKAWVELIKHEARTDEVEQELLLASPTHQRASVLPGTAEVLEHDRFASSSPEPSIRHSSITPAGIKMPGFRRPSGPSLDYSGDETGPYSDFSDTPSGSLARQSSNFGKFVGAKHNAQQALSTIPLNEIPTQQIPVRHASQSNGSQPGPQSEQQQDNDRVIWHGYLLYLKIKGGVRQWKRTWAVLRPMHLAFYKNDDEYAARLIIPLANIINAVEIDPISKSKTACMQIITEDRSHRVCAYSEDALAEWLGALKSQLAKKK